MFDAHQYHNKSVLKTRVAVMRHTNHSETLPFLAILLSGLTLNLILNLILLG